MASTLPRILEEKPKYTPEMLEEPSRIFDELMKENEQLKKQLGQQEGKEKGGILSSLGGLLKSTASGALIGGGAALGGPSMKDILEGQYMKSQQRKQDALSQKAKAEAGALIDQQRMSGTAHRLISGIFDMKDPTKIMSAVTMLSMSDPDSKLITPIMKHLSDKMTQEQKLKASGNVIRALQKQNPGKYEHLNPNEHYDPATLSALVSSEHKRAATKDIIQNVMQKNKLAPLEYDIKEAQRGFEKSKTRVSEATEGSRIRQEESKAIEGRERARKVGIEAGITEKFGSEAAQADHELKKLEIQKRGIALETQKELAELKKDGLSFDNAMKFVRQKYAERNEKAKYYHLVTQEKYLKHLMSKAEKDTGTKVSTIVSSNISPKIVYNRIDRAIESLGMMDEGLSPEKLRSILDQEASAIDALRRGTTSEADHRYLDSIEELLVEISNMKLMGIRN